jgi:digeranylgeranylglycerophospholipid reductase
MEEYDVLIAGGGPIGAAVGAWCAADDHTVAIYEDHAHIGIPMHCAGLVTDRAFTIPNLPKDDLILNTITGAQIHSPSGHSIYIGGDHTHALVIDRARYDQALMHKATQAGAILHTRVKITEAGQTEEDVWVSNPQYSARGKILVGADGAHSTIRSLFDFPRPIEFLEGVGAIVSDVSLDPQTVIIYLGSNMAPGFFAWIIPLNRSGTEARIGLCKLQKTSLTLRQCFETLLQAPPLAHAQVNSRYGGLVPLGPVEPAVQSRVMLVGDAAGQVKPTSGGGIVTGLLCGRACAGAIHQALCGPSLSVRELSRYQSLWKRTIGRELSMGMMFRSYFRVMADRRIDQWINDLDKPAVLAAIARAGDIDYPSRLLLPVIRASPGLAAKLPGIILSRSRSHRLRGAGGT